MKPEFLPLYKVYKGYWLLVIGYWLLVARSAAGQAAFINFVNFDTRNLIHVLNFMNFDTRNSIHVLNFVNFTIKVRFLVGKMTGRLQAKNGS